MQGEQSELDAAIDSLYAAFAGHVRPEWIDACPCCWDGPLVEPPREQSQPRVRAVSPGGRRQVRELTAKDLADIANHVPLTCGTIDDLKHYLPRVLEIAVQDEQFDIDLEFDGDLEVVLSRLSPHHPWDGPPWTTWPAPEQEAIVTFLHALWRQRLTAEPDRYHGIDEVLTGIGNIDPDMDWYLAEWLRFEHPKAAGNLESFLWENMGTFSPGKLMNAFWERDHSPARENIARIAEWARSDATKDAIAAAADLARSPEERETLTEIYLRWLPAD